MAIGALDAAAAYGRTMQTVAGVRGGANDVQAIGTGSGASPSSFGTMVEGMINNASQSLRAAEVETAKQVAGKGDLIDVVTALGAAETALDTIVAVRDRVVNAYSEIMRMQI